jgi:hypothetical protein
MLLLLLYVNGKKEELLFIIRWSVPRNWVYNSIFFNNNKKRLSCVFQPRLSLEAEMKGGVCGQAPTARIFENIRE